MSGLLGIEKGALIEIVKGVFGGPASPRGWWKELLDTLPGDVVPMEEARETSTRNQNRALSTENEEAGQSWHDEGKPDSFVSVVQDGKSLRRKQASTSPSRRIVLKLRICDWSGDAWNSAAEYLLTGSADIISAHFQAKVPNTAVVNFFLELREHVGLCSGYDAGQPKECGHELKGGIWNGMHAGTGHRRQHRGTPSDLRGHSRAYFDRRVGFGVAAESDGTHPY